MAEAATFEEPHGNPAVRWGLIVLGVVVVLALIWYLYNAMNGVHGVKVKEDAPVTVSPMLPPPPPPPPPPKPQEKPPEPTETPKPAPEAAAPKPDAPAPMQMNAEAQAGPGTLAAGTGGGGGAPGSTGTCLSNCGGPVGGAISDGFYARYLSSALQQRVQRDSKVNRSVFTAEFAIWITSGRVTRANLIRGSGDDKRDALLKAIIEAASDLDTPPSSFKFPQRITVKGRKSL